MSPRTPPTIVSFAIPTIEPRQAEVLMDLLEQLQAAIGWFGRVGECNLRKICYRRFLQIRFGEGKMALEMTMLT